MAAKREPTEGESVSGDLIGRELAHYRVVAKLGAGGMGEVYRATDTRLGREVAVKVLPPGWTADAERVARFEREARLLAQLHHPHVASVFGFEKVDGQHALILELVEGPTLAERLESSPLPVDDAVEIANQIAEALEEAHAKGIVHRDLKPQTVKAPIDGPVKVLDFGLAKMVGRGSTTASALAAVPTLTPGTTAGGVVLGTRLHGAAAAQGLGGRQAGRLLGLRGRALRDADGESLFAGDTAHEILANVLKGDVDLGRLPPQAPPAISRLLRRCLERNPRNRLHDVVDARIVLGEVLSGVADEDVPQPAPPPGLATLAVGLLSGRLVERAGHRADADGERRIPLALPPGLGDRRGGIRVVCRLPRRQSEGGGGLQSDHSRTRPGGKLRRERCGLA